MLQRDEQPRDTIVINCNTNMNKQMFLSYGQSRVNRDGQARVTEMWASKCYRDMGKPPIMLSSHVNFMGSHSRCDDDNFDINTAIRNV